MALKKGNSQVYFVLPDELIQELDKLAETEYMSRSMYIQRIVVEHLKEKDQKK